MPDPLSIPDVLQITLRGREVADDDPAHGERFLMHSGQGGTMLVFCENTELKALHQGDYLVCNGTFEMSPNSAYQAYTVHGYSHGEGVPLLWALLPNKTTDTYAEMFEALRMALISKYGNIGAIKYILTDFNELLSMP